jgi:hypothetical protein
VFLNFQLAGLLFDVGMTMIVATVVFLAMMLNAGTGRRSRHPHREAP